MKFYPLHLKSSLVILVFLMLNACSSTTKELDEKEKMMLGYWMKRLDNGQVKGWYMEFSENRTGFFGPVLNVDENELLLPFMSLSMKTWEISNDTLIIESEINSNYEAFGPDGRKIPKNEKPSYISYKVWETSDSVMVLEDLNSGASLKRERFIRTHKLEF